MHANLQWLLHLQESSEESSSKAKSEGNASGETSALTWWVSWGGRSGGRIATGASGLGAGGGRTGWVGRNGVRVALSWVLRGGRGLSRILRVGRGLSRILAGSRIAPGGIGGRSFSRILAGSRIPVGGIAGGLSGLSGILRLGRRNRIASGRVARCRVGWLSGVRGLNWVGWLSGWRGNRIATISL